MSLVAMPIELLFPFWAIAVNVTGTPVTVALLGTGIWTWVLAIA